VVSLLVRIFLEVMLVAVSSVVHHPGVQSLKPCWVSREHQLLHVESLISIQVISDKDVPSPVDFGLTTICPEGREFVLGDLSVVVVVHLINEVLSDVVLVSTEASVISFLPPNRLLKVGNGLCKRFNISQLVSLQLAVIIPLRRNSSVIEIEESFEINVFHPIIFKNKELISANFSISISVQYIDHFF